MGDFSHDWLKILEDLEIIIGAKLIHIFHEEKIGFYVLTFEKDGQIIKLHCGSFCDDAKLEILESQP